MNTNPQIASPRGISGEGWAAIAGAVGFAIVPKLDDSDVQLSHRSVYSGFHFTRHFSDPLSQNSEVLKRSQAEIAAFLMQKPPHIPKDESPMTNVLTGAELQVEDSPGNFTVEKQADKVIVRTYDRIGGAFLTTYPSGINGDLGKPDPATGSDPGPIR